MSLRIFVRGEDNTYSADVIHDVELAFLRVKLQPTEYNINAIKTIEQGTYNDDYSFIDRFGFKLYTTNLSTGCKAAICVNAFKDCIIDTIECVINVLSYIIANCTDGMILVSRDAMVFHCDSDIDVIMDGIHFTNCNELLEHISER